MPLKDQHIGICKRIKSQELRLYKTTLPPDKFQQIIYYHQMQPVNVQNQKPEHKPECSMLITTAKLHTALKSLILTSFYLKKKITLHISIFYKPKW